MTRARNFLIAYVLLVGLPVFGLIGILERGRTLTAPISIDGVWKFQGDFRRLAGSPCEKSFSTIEDSVLRISQSGKYLTLSLPNGTNATGAGTIEGTTVMAAMLPLAASSSETSCGNKQRLCLTAHVDTQAKPQVLLGMMRITDCTSGPSIEFRAVKEGTEAGR